MKKYLFIIALMFITSIAEATTRYVCDTVANCNANGGSGWSGTSADSGTCGSKANPCKTIRYGMTQMSSGDTLIVGNSTYTGTNNQLTWLTGNEHLPPAGSSTSQYSTIQAEVPLRAVLDGEGARNMLDVRGLSGHRLPKYLKFQGLAFIRGSGIYQIANGDGTEFTTSDLSTAFDAYYYFKGCAFGEIGADESGTIYVFYIRNVIWEDCISWGSGRYGWEAYIADKLIVRRHIDRRDAAQRYSSYPAASYINYCGHDIEFQNVIAIDVDTTDGWDTTLGPFGGFYVRENYEGRTSQDTGIRGSIVLNFNATGATGEYGEQGSGLFTKNDASNTQLKDMIFWATSMGIYGNNIGTVTADHITVGNQAYLANTGWRYAFGNDSSILVTNSNCTDAANLTISTISGSSSYNNDNGCGGSWSGSNITTSDTNYQYIFKPETSFPDGSDGRKKGADIRYAYGRSGTYWGETGYATLQDGSGGESTVKLWPWGVGFTGDNSFEARIWALMRANDGAATETRGFCGASQSITNWVATGAGTITPTNALTVDGSGGTSLSNVNTYIYEDSEATVPTTVTGVTVSGGSIQ